MSFADKLSVLRIILIPFFVALLIYSHSYPYLVYAALGVFFLAVLSDIFDGLVARIKKEKSAIGKVIDPLADKLLLLTAFLTLYFLEDFTIPFAVVLVVVSRDLIILLGVLLLNFMKIEVPIAPSAWGKCTTFFQMLTIICALVSFPFSYIVWTITVVFTIVSGIGYIARGIRSINLANSSSH